MKTVHKNPKERPFSIKVICNGFYLKRDAYYKYQKRYVKRKQIENHIVELAHKAVEHCPEKALEN